jgi:succinoglycan biosynthesis protein ExoV
LIPKITSNDSDEYVVYGMGTVLGETLPKNDQKIVLGAGTGYGSPPRIDDTFKIYCVRGPRTAKVLNLPQEKACVDPAVLVRKFFSYDGEKEYRFSYMPHFSEAIPNADSWRTLCENAGIHYIDPRLTRHQSVEDVLTEIAKTEVLLSEAMHGAIVADALRVPWIAIRTKPDILPFKWKDWTSSLHLRYRAWRIRRAGSLLNRENLVRRTVWYGVLLQMKCVCYFGEPQLSDVEILRRREAELLNRIGHFVDDYKSGRL